MDRRTYLATTGAVVGSGFAGCLGNSESSDDDGNDGDGDEAMQTGVLSTAVSDDPADIGDFERLVVTVNEVWVHPAGSEDEGGEEGSGEESGEESTEDEESAESGGDETKDEEGSKQEGEESDGDETKEGEEDGEESDGKTHDESAEPIRIDVDGAEADLVQLQGDAQKVINSAEIDVGTYGQIKLWVGDEVDAVLTDGSEADVMTPGNAPLKFNKEFEIRPNTETTFTADFAPHKRGPNGYVLKPVATEVRVEYNEIAADGGESGTDNETTTSDGSSSDNGSTTSDGSGTDNESGT